MIMWSNTKIMNVTQRTLNNLLSVSPSHRYFPPAHLANIPGLDVLQLQQQLLVAASLKLLYERSAVRRLWGRESKRGGREEGETVKDGECRPGSNTNYRQRQHWDAYSQLQWGFSLTCFCQPSLSISSIWCSCWNVEHNRLTCSL